MERLLLLTTAVVGIISLIATMVVQYETQQQFQRVEIELDNIRVNIDRAATEAREAKAESEAAANNGSIDAILALQERIAALEGGGRRTSTSTTASGITGDDQAVAAGLEGPAVDCIPLGTRFMTQIGDELAICHTPVVVNVTGITADSVTAANAGTIVENGFGPIRGTPCTLALLSADAEGFAELRVTC